MGSEYHSNHHPPKRKVSTDHGSGSDDYEDQDWFESRQDGRTSFHRNNSGFRSPFAARHNSVDFRLESRQSNSVTNDTRVIHPERLRQIATNDGAFSPTINTPPTPALSESLDATLEFRIKGAASPSVIPQHTEQQIGKPYAATMASPVKSPHSSSVVSRSERSTPRPQAPSAGIDATSGSSSDLRAFMKAFSQYTQSVVETTIIQIRSEALDLDVRRQNEEHNRWSKYYDSYVSIGEDQRRKLKATEHAKEQSQKQLNQAKQTSDKAMRLIAETMLAVSSGNRLPLVEDNATSKLQEKVTGQSKEISSLKEEIRSLKNEIGSLRLSVVDTKSDHYRLNEVNESLERQNKEISELWKDSVRKSVYRESEAKLIEDVSDLSDQLKHSRKHQEQDISDLWDDTLRKSVFREYEAKIDKRLSDFTAQTKGLVNLTSQKDSYKKDLSDLEARKFESFTSQCQIDIKDLRKEIDDISHGFDERSSAVLSKLKADMSTTRQDIATFQEFKGHAENELNRMRERVGSISNGPSNVEESVQSLKQEYIALSRIVQRLGKRLETQAAETERLDGDLKNEISKGRDIKNDIQDVRTICEGSQKRVESCAEVVQQLRTEQAALTTEQKALNHRLGETEQHRAQLPTIKVIQQLRTEQAALTTEQKALSHRIGETEQLREQLPAMISEHAKHPLPHQLAEGKAEELEHRVEEIFQSLSQTIEEMKQGEVKRDEETAQEIDGFNDVLIKQTAEFEKQKMELVTHKSLLDRIIAEQASFSASLEHVKAEVNSLTRVTNSLLGEKEAQSPFFDQLQSNMSELQRQFQTLQKPIQPPPSPTPFINEAKEELQRKIEALESNVRDFKGQLTDKVNAMESFLATQESRWNNMTTEPMIKSVVYQMNQIYPLQHLQNELGQTKQRQELTDVKINSLFQVINNNRDVDSSKFSKLEKAAQEWRDAFQNAQNTFDELRHNVTRLDRDFHDMDLRLQQLKPSEQSPEPRTQNDAEVAKMKASLDRLLQLGLEEFVSSVKSDIEPLKVRVNIMMKDMAIQASNLSEALNLRGDIERHQRNAGSVKEGVGDCTSLQNEFQALRKSMDSVKQEMEDRTTNFYDAHKETRSSTELQAKEMQTLTARVGALETKINEVWDNAVAEIASLDLKVDKVKASHNPGVGIQEVDETQDNFVSARGSDGDSDSDVVVRRSRKRPAHISSHSSQSSQELKNNEKPKKKRPRLDDSDSCSEHESSRSPQETRKSARNLSQQTEYQSPGRRKRGRPKKAAD
ncbi:MAG: hypothetical protein Q9181_006715 [Wetmoreana brouardii]